jgi:hypothetical protein
VSDQVKIKVTTLVERHVTVTTRTRPFLLYPFETFATNAEGVITSPVRTFRTLAAALFAHERLCAKMISANKMTTYLVLWLLH